MNKIVKLDWKPLMLAANDGEVVPFSTPLTGDNCEMILLVKNWPFIDLDEFPLKASLELHIESDNEGQ